ncbi:hypothetical protein GCM10010211_47150 [Streptomyces albospinus]|uniref:DUF5133 domain-containing protein n=1 Tax=Streptomyces albospinus TaxID=285515 RepID=A0ABQ2V9S8_9ACTN|nr:DUF5133 domain-containing protein [Streptomyces albospinus]GGU75794.1 hypothetical protein GCM10010211_47150 [Streptomyces albospinus]
MLLPDKSVLASLLRRYRVWERMVLADPHDPAARQRLEDIAYTLCVLMGRRTVQEAIIEAERYLAAGRTVPRTADRPKG